MNTNTSHWKNEYEHRTLNVELRTEEGESNRRNGSSFSPNSLRFSVGRSMFNVRRSHFSSVQRWTFDVRSSTFAFLFFVLRPLISDNHGLERKGDIPHTQADISKAKTLLGYAPDFNFQQGILQAAQWYFSHLQAPV
jgi:hypothetical protein